jgi:hypothetical protein
LQAGGSALAVAALQLLKHAFFADLAGEREHGFQVAVGKHTTCALC